MPRSRNQRLTPDRLLHNVSDILHMKRSLPFALMLLLCCKPVEKVPENVVGEINIVPQPALVKRLGGTFELTRTTTVVATDEAGVRNADSLNKYLAETIGFSLNVAASGSGTSDISFVTTPDDGAGKVSEGYELTVAPGKVEIKGSEIGQFYGIQSLIQMMPVEPAESIQIPAASISDSPRFKYRGIHLDEARHFMGVEFVEKYIRLAARYKLNYFHWHLTDDQGWRIEIAKWPKLTEIGSTRPESVVDKNYNPYKGDGVRVSGFYSKAEIKRIVDYARAQHITIVPEIEMPGHASAALAAYPEFGCRGSGGYKVKTTWTAPPDGFTEIMCPSDETFGFLKDVLDEVVEMFPDSPYIHIGGDETNMAEWRSSALVQNIKTQQGFTTEHEVLKWFIDRVGEHVAERGRKIICWDDMIGDGQIPNAVISSWKGVNIGAIAAQNGREVIMMPDDKLYFDRPQSEGEPRVTLGQVTTMQDVFNFDPVKGMQPTAANNVIGGQGLIWTEFIKTPADVEYMAFPRMLALAEMLWTRPTVSVSANGEKIKDFPGFVKRLDNQFFRLDREKVNYRIPEPSGLRCKRLAIGERFRLDLSTPIRGAQIFYTIDGTEPNENSTLFRGPVDLPATATEVKAITITSDGRKSQAVSCLLTALVSAPTPRRN